ncbi:TetR/AcrR family transcriptional regulator [Actinocorallia populi]|uniref:TetR/AcrR family transcriptional regulator n=1 Tax=Actinocorallia populi TaxID=2079200 RepID=UPI0018E51A95|nr:TetR family transcriptional regulator [Actinocorallia populi]
MTASRDVRPPVRDRLLDAARRLIETRGWAQMRVAHIASEAGVSRQSAYNEFGSKAALGEALVMREFERHLAGLGECLLDQRDDIEAAVAEAVLYTFRRASRDTVLHSILTSARVGWSAEGLVAVLRRRKVPPLTLALRTVTDLALHQRPDLDPEALQLTVDMVCRVTVSYLVTPEGPPEDSARRIAAMAVRVLGVPVR